MTTAHTLFDRKVALLQVLSRSKGYIDGCKKKERTS